MKVAEGRFPADDHFPVPGACQRQWLIIPPGIGGSEHDRLAYIINTSKKLDCYLPGNLTRRRQGPADGRKWSRPGTPIGITALRGNIEAGLRKHQCRP